MSQEDERVYEKVILLTMKRYGLSLGIGNGPQIVEAIRDAYQRGLRDGLAKAAQLAECNHGGWELPDGTPDKSKHAGGWLEEECEECQLAAAIRALQEEQQ